MAYGAHSVKGSNSGTINSVWTEICTSFSNNSVLKKNSCLHYLLPRPRGVEAEKLRRRLPFVPQTARTTPFQQSYMIYALNKLITNYSFVV